MKKFLQVVGVLTLLGILGASVAALLTVKEHLHLTIAGETADRKTGPDPVALLRDDVASLRRDLDALSQALTKNFEALAAHEDEADAERRTAVERAVAPLQEALARLQEGLAASERAQGDRAEAVRQE